jgi:hypothetical protein
MGHTPQNSNRTIAAPVATSGQQRAGLSGEAVVHIQRSSYDMSLNDRSGSVSKDCFDAKPILQDGP